MRIEGILKKKLDRHTGVSKTTNVPYDLQDVLVEATETYTRRDGSTSDITHTFVITCRVKDGAFGFEEGTKMYFELYFNAEEYKGRYYPKCSSRFYYAMNN